MQSAKFFTGTQKHQAAVQAHAAATATETVVVFSAPHACKVTAVYINPATGSTGNDTNTTNLNLITGASTEIANLDLPTGVNLTANTDNTIASGLTTTLAAGAALKLQFEKVGTGVLVDASIVTVDYVSV